MKVYLGPDQKLKVFIQDVPDTEIALSIKEVIMIVDFKRTTK